MSISQSRSVALSEIENRSSMRKIRVTIVVLTTIIIYWFYVYNETESPRQFTLQNEVSDNRQEETGRFPSQLKDLASQPIYIQHHLCKPLLDVMKKNDNQWRISIDDFLVHSLESYDSSDIKKALFLLEGDDFAYSKREILRNPDRNLIDREKKVSSLFRNEMGRDAPKALRISFGVNTLQSLFESSKEKRGVTIQKFGLLVVEVAEAIRSKKFSNQQLVELMSLLGDVNGHTQAAANYFPDNLLDAIIDSNNEILFDAYINLGGKVINREFGVNVLERLVSYIKFDTESFSDGLINRLVEHHLPIRVTYTSNGKGEDIELGAFWKKHIRDPDNFKLLVSKLNLIVTDAPVKDSLHDNSIVQEILEKLKNEKLATRLPGLSGINSNEIEICQTIRNNVSQEVTFVKGQKKIVEAKVLFGEEQLAVAEYLSETEPALVDCYLKPQGRLERTSLVDSDDYSETLSKITDGDVHAGIRHFNSAERSNNEKAYLFWDVVSLRLELVSFLVESGIVPQRDDFYWAASRLDGKSYSIIESLGFSYDHEAPTGKSLTEYAARQCNADLIAALNQLEKPYTYQTLGNDALNSALTTINCRNEKARLAVITAVMKFKPTVKQSHLHDIADLRLKDYSTYLQVVASFPQLEIGRDVEPSQYSCFGMYP